MENELKKTVEEFLGVEITDDQENLLDDILYETQCDIEDLETKMGWFKILLSLRKLYSDCLTEITNQNKFIGELKVLLRNAGKTGKAFYNLFDSIYGVRDPLNPLELNDIYDGILNIEEK